MDDDTTDIVLLVGNFAASGEHLRGGHILSGPVNSSQQPREVHRAFLSLVQYLRRIPTGPAAAG